MQSEITICTIIFTSPKNIFQEEDNQTYFWESLKNMFCPSLQFFSFTTFIILLVIVGFVLQCIWGYIEMSFIEIEFSQIQRMGVLDPFLIVMVGQYYRIFTSPFLHIDLNNCLLTIILLSIVASYLQHRLQKKFIFVFLGGILLGQLAVLALSSKPTLTTLSLLSACLGIYQCVLICKWQTIQGSERRLVLVLILSTIIVFYLVSFILQFQLLLLMIFSSFGSLLLSFGIQYRQNQSSQIFNKVGKYLSVVIYMVIGNILIIACFNKKVQPYIFN